MARTPYKQRRRIIAYVPIPIPADSDNPTWKYFKDCVGALDGTYVNVRTNLASQARYRSRKGNAAINILAVCNPNTEFIYCLAGWEGSAHDSRVLRDALSRPGGLRVPEGTYYLCDARYTNANGFLIPYRKQRYHLQEWGTNRPRTAKEFYNMKHSSARNCIERAFGKNAVGSSTRYFMILPQNGRDVFHSCLPASIISLLVSLEEQMYSTGPTYLLRL
ncbi:hypothetical protein LINGRAHAP2_LOCUS6587 [Linum grandiflorum]